MQDTPEAISLCGERSSPANTQVRSDVANRHPWCKNNGFAGSRRGRGGDRRSAKRQGPPRMSREIITLEIAAKEYVWLWDRRHGISIEAIAAREDLSTGRVRFGVARARAQERSTATASAVRPPRLVPLFPIGAYTPQSSCAHRRAIEPGSSLCCMVCHSSGMDRHPALRRDPRTEPAPEPKPKVTPQVAKSPRETRKVRRKRLFGAHS